MRDQDIGIAQLRVTLDPKSGLTLDQREGNAFQCTSSCATDAPLYLLNLAAAHFGTDSKARS